MNQIYTLTVGPNVGDLGAVVAVGQVAAENRQVDLGASAAAGDKVGLLGATNAAGPFHEVPIAPATGPNPPLVLSVPRSTVIFTSRFTHYRTVRLDRPAIGSALASVRLTAVDLPSNAPGAVVHREFEITYTEFAALAAGVTTFTKTVVDAADIPGGAVVLALIGDAVSFVAFNDGTNPVTEAFLGTASVGGGLIDTMTVGNGATGLVSAAFGDITDHNLYLPLEDIEFSIVGANDLNGYTSGHIKVKLVLGVPAGF